MSARTVSTLLALLRPRDLPVNDTQIDGKNYNPFVFCVADRCACDWRVTVYDCDDSNFLFVVYQFGMWIGCLSLALGFVVLLYRRLWLGHRFLLARGSEEGMRLTSIINPKPVEVYLICVVLHLVGEFQVHLSRGTLSKAFEYTSYWWKWPSRTFRSNFFYFLDSLQCSLQLPLERM